MPCPSDKLIEAYAAHRLTAKEQWVKGHVSGCPACTAKLLAPATKNNIPTLPKGCRVGRYIVERELGLGGMSRVYVAKDPELDRKVALKLMRDGPDERLSREAKAMARLSHPNVVAVYDVGRHDGHVFIAMELVEGLDGRHWLADPRSWEDILRVFIEAGTGLAVAHSKGLLHRDFKPPNVLIGADGRVRVADFGIAKAVDTNGATPITRAGTMVGTFGYLAPEVMLGQELDARADQFSFAVSLFEALNGLRPYKGANYAEYYAGLMAGPPEEAARSFPSWLFKAVRRGLALKPNERFASMEEMLAALSPPKGLFESLLKR